MLLYVIRHGDPIYDPDSLTEKGKLQAQALSKRLAVHGLDRIYTSPMQRARMTAAPTCERLGIEPEELAWASENLAWKDFTYEKEPGVRDWCTHLPNTRYKTPEVLALGERWYEAWPFCHSNAKQGFERIARESDAFLEGLGYRRDGMHYQVLRDNGERVAVFCHYGFGLAWLSHLLSIPPPLFWGSFDLSHSGVTILHFSETAGTLTAPKCIALSDLSHIYADGLPLQFSNYLDI